MPGCDMKCKLSNTWRRIAKGTTGLCLPIEVSHTRVSLEVKVSRSSERLEESEFPTIYCSSGSVD